LKLESAKGSVEFLVIDDVEMTCGVDEDASSTRNPVPGMGEF
jgi:hypothetical protein